jgi:hypothetical protein
LNLFFCFLFFSFLFSRAFRASEASFFSRAQRATLGRRRLDARFQGASSARKESAVKPGSVVDSHSSGMRVAAQL